MARGTGAAVLLVGLMLLVGVKVTWAQGVIAACDEAALRDALANATDGDTLRFACDGTISITEPYTINADVSLDADGHDVILDGGNLIRIFTIDRRATVTINGVTMQRASATSGGSAIHNLGTLTVTDSRFIRNVHAIANFGVLRVERAVFDDNFGVGIYNSGQLVVTGSTFTANAHGIDNASGILTVANSTFYANVFNRQNGIGAGLANSGTATVINCTFVDNRAELGGGGVATHRGGTVTLINTLIVGEDETGTCRGGMIDGGGNLQYPGTACGANIPSVDPLLAEEVGADGLSVFVPGAESAALNAGDVDACGLDPVNGFDQRGAFRFTEVSARCDSGAVERH